MPRTKPRHLVITRPCEIESHPFKAGDVVGRLNADGSIQATAEGVEPGHIMARMTTGIIAEGDPADYLDPKASQAAPPQADEAADLSPPE